LHVLSFLGVFKTEKPRQTVYNSQAVESLVISRKSFRHKLQNWPSQLITTEEVNSSQGPKLTQSCSLCIVIGPVCGFVYVFVGVFVCLWVCYHDNSKLCASILTKLGF